MHSISCSLLALSISLCPSSSSGDEPLREFSNAEGKTIKARPVNVHGNKVCLAFENGRKIDVSPSVFKLDDQMYLKHWATGFLASNHSLFAVSAARKVDKVKEYKKDVPLASGAVMPNALEIKEYKGYYVITLDNRSEFELDPLRVEYRIYIKKDNPAKKDLHDVTNERLEGTLDYILKPRCSLALNTKDIIIVETKMGQGVYWGTGGDVKTRTTLVGVWLRIYNGKDMVREFSLPSTLPEREKW